MPSKLHTLLLMALASGTALSSMGAWDDEFDYASDLEEQQRFRLYWSNLEDDVIELGIEAESTGWIAVGISPNGGMVNSDIILAWVDDANSSVHLEDRHTGDTESMPLLDAQQNLELIAGEQVI